VNSYYDPQIKETALAEIEKCAAEVGGSFEFCKVDITDIDAMRAIFQEHKFSHVLHLAAQAGVRYSIDNAPSNIATNVTGTVNIFELIKEFGPQDIVLSFASSSSVYGQSSVAPFSEDQLCDQPISPYAATKRACELLAYTYHHLYQMDIMALRFFTVYGPRGRPDMAAFKFIDLISEDKTIDKYGDGSMVREFTYIDDIVDGVIGSIERLVSPTKPRFTKVNLGGGATHTLNEFIETIEKHIGKKAIINHMPNQPGDVKITSADQTVSKFELGFEPKVSLDEGIKRTVMWYNKYKTPSNTPDAERSRA